MINKNPADRQIRLYLNQVVDWRAYNIPNDVLHFPPDTKQRIVRVNINELDHLVAKNNQSLPMLSPLIQEENAGEAARKRPNITSALVERDVVPWRRISTN